MRGSRTRRLLAVFDVVGVLGTLGAACTTPAGSSSTPDSQLANQIFGGPLSSVSFASAVIAIEKLLTGGYAF
jgi:hypothetical protein